MSIEAKLDGQDIVDLMPVFLVVKLAGNPHCDEVFFAEVVLKVVDRHVAEARKGVDLKVLPTDTAETCTYYYAASRETCDDPALALLKGEARCQHHVILALKVSAQKEAAKNEE